MNTNEIENNKKSQNIKSIVLIIIVVVLISLIGFAFARYITQLNGNTEAQIAIWNFNVTAGSSQNLNIDLSQTRFENDTQEVDRTKVAPGTSGALILNVNATNTQVSLKYDIDIDLTEIPENLIFYSDSNMTNAMYKENGIIHLEGYFDQGTNNKTDAITFYWQWPIETGSTQNEIDANDLLDSNWIGAQPEISISVTGRQVMQEQETNKYAVTFDANGGTIQGYGNSSQTTKMVTYGESYGDLPTPTREGYNFKGWNGKNLFNINKLININRDNYNIRIENNKIILTGTKYACATEMYLNELISNISTGEQITLSFVTTSSKNFIYLWGINYQWNNSTSKIVSEEMLESKVFIYNEISPQEENVVEISEIQIEKGSTVTAYEPYFITSSTEVVQNQNHTLTAIWEPKLNP